jgi:DNA-binding transcriptional LysR family regulator
MPETLTRMAATYPEVRIEMTQREPETALHETWARDFDIVIAEQYPGHAAPRYPELDRIRLTTDAIRLAVPPASDDRPALTSLAETAEMAWVMEPRGAASRHWAEQACRSAGFEPDVRFETADLQAQIRLIESGNAVGLMPDLVWTGRGTTAELIELPQKPHRTVFTSVRRSSAQRPAILAAREILAATASSIAASKDHEMEGPA